jgi:hypothetical protein
MRSRFERRRLAALVLLAMCVAAAACDSHQSRNGQDNGTVLLTGGGAPLATPIRGCDAAVFGSLASNWRERAVFDGPLAWPGLANYAPESPAALTCLRELRDPVQRRLHRRGSAVCTAGGFRRREERANQGHDLVRYGKRRLPLTARLVSCPAGSRTFGKRRCQQT